MNQLWISLLMAGTALAASAGVLARTVRAQIAAGWTSTSTFILVIAWLYFVPSTMIQVRGARTTIVDPFSNKVVVVDPAIVGFQRLLTPAMIGIGLVVFLYWTLLRRRRPRLAPILAIGIAIISTVVTANQGGSVFDVRQAAVVSLLLAASVAPGGRGGVLGVAAVGVSVAIASGFLAVVNYGYALRDCRLDKCGLLGHLYYGIFTDENTLAVIMAVALPCIFLAFSGKSRLWLTLYVAGMVVATGSRSGLFAAVVTVAVLLLTRPRLTRALQPGAAMCVRLVALGGTMVGVALPLMAFEPGTFTGRAGLWELARQQLSQSIWWGLGGKAWSANVNSGLITADQAYSVHNQWLEAGYTGGVVGFALLVLLAAVMAATGRSERPALSLVVLLPVIVLGIFERPLAFTSLDVFTWIFPAVFLALPDRRAGTSALNQSAGVGASAAEPAWVSV